MSVICLNIAFHFYEPMLPQSEIPHSGIVTVILSAVKFPLRYRQ